MTNIHHDKYLTHAKSTQSVLFLMIPNWRLVQNIRVFPHDARGFAKKIHP